MLQGLTESFESEPELQKGQPTDSDRSQCEQCENHLSAKTVHIGKNTKYYIDGLISQESTLHEKHHARYARNLVGYVDG